MATTISKITCLCATILCFAPSSSSHPLLFKLVTLHPETRGFRRSIAEYCPPLLFSSFSPFFSFFLCFYHNMRWGKRNTTSSSFKDLSSEDVREGGEGETLSLRERDGGHSDGSPSAPFPDDHTHDHGADNHLSNEDHGTITTGTAITLDQVFFNLQFSMAPINFILSLFRR